MEGRDKVYAEEMFTNHMSNKGLIFIKCKDLNNKKTTQFLVLQALTFVCLFVSAMAHMWASEGNLRVLSGTTWVSGIKLGFVWQVSLPAKPPPQGGFFSSQGYARSGLRRGKGKRITLLRLNFKPLARI